MLQTLQNARMKLVALVACALLAVAMAPAFMQSESNQAHAAFEGFSLNIPVPNIGDGPTSDPDPYRATWPLTGSGVWTNTNGTSVSQLEPATTYNYTATLLLGGGSYEFDSDVWDEGVFFEAGSCELENAAISYSSDRKKLYVKGTYTMPSVGSAPMYGSIVKNASSSVFTNFSITASRTNFAITANHSMDYNYKVSYLVEDAVTGRYCILRYNTAYGNASFTPGGFEGGHLVGYAILSSNIPSGMSTTENTWYALSSSNRSALRSKANYQDVWLPDPEVSSLTLHNLGTTTFKKASVNWTGYDTSIMTGVEVYVNGTLKGTVTSTFPDSYSGFAIPYYGTQKVKARAYREYNGKTYYGPFSNEVSVSSSKIKSPRVVPVMISTNKAHLSWDKAAHASGYYIYMKKGSGSWKKVGSTTKTSYVCKKTSAGKSTTKYRIRSYIKTDGKTYSAPSYGTTVKNLANKYTATKYSPKKLKDFDTYIKATDVHYTKAGSKGKLKITVNAANTHIYTSGIKGKVTVYNQGVTIATGTFKVSNIHSDSSKSITYTFSKCKTGYDLRTASVTWSNVKEI